MYDCPEIIEAGWVAMLPRERAEALRRYRHLCPKVVAAYEAQGVECIPGANFWPEPHRSAAMAARRAS